MGTERRALVRPRPVQYLNSSSHGQDLSSTSGKAEPVTVVESLKTTLFFLEDNFLHSGECAFEHIFFVGEDGDVII
jgi:hypothetical protein